MPAKTKAPKSKEVHPILIRPRVEQRDIIAQAAEIDGRTVAEFIVHHATQTAKTILKNSDNSV